MRSFSVIETKTERLVRQGAAVTYNPDRIESIVFNSPLSHDQFCALFESMSILYGAMLTSGRVVDLWGDPVDSATKREEILKHLGMMMDLDAKDNQENHDGR